MLAVLVVVFVICWTPTHILDVIQLWDADVKVCKTWTKQMWAMNFLKGKTKRYRTLIVTVHKLLTKAGPLKLHENFVVCTFDNNRQPMIKTMYFASF